MELLETSATDALTARSAAAAAAGSGRKSSPAPKLTDRNTATTVRIAAPKTTISDDPYADQMPELEVFEDSAAGTRTIPEVDPSIRIAPAARPQIVAARPASIAIVAPPPARAPIAAASPAVISPRPAAAPASSPVSHSAPVPRKTPPAPRPAIPATAKNIPNPESVAVPPVMDREFIARNRIVELYLSGGLPVRGATVFERFCRENPQILDEIGLPERVHTALRLLDASGKPEPWQEKPKRFWERPYLPAALAGLVVILGIAALVLNSRVTEQTHKVTALRQLVATQPIDAATGSSNVYLNPTHAGPTSAASATIGGTAAQLVNIKIDLNHSDYRAFRITIDRLNQGRVAVLNNLIKDSNGALGFALNTSALGPDIYQLSIEGLDWRGDPQPDSWAAITIRH
ncbi:MAG: hypothetical protein WDM77_05835 [Steroidobacteraceae bacterium]